MQERAHIGVTCAVRCSGSMLPLGKKTVAPGEPNFDEYRGEERLPAREGNHADGIRAEIDQVTCWWPRPGEETPREKHTFDTQVVGQNCGVGYYRQ